MSQTITISRMVTAPTKVEKEITVPYFFKDCYAGVVYKVIDEKRVVTAFDGEGYNNVSVQSLSADVLKYLNSGTEITEQDFNEAFRSALSKIQNPVQ